MSRRIEWLIRGALALVYVWFGALKLLHFSPVTQLVQDLFELTVPFLSFGTFLYLFASFEVLLGIAFLVPRLTRIACVATLLHLAATALPLVLLPHEAWSGFLVPTFEGEFIIKNVLILACACALYAHRKPAQ